MKLNLLNRFSINEWPLSDPIIHAVTDFQSLNRFDQLNTQCLINSALYVDTVSANAGLAAITELGRHDAFNGKIDISIIENDNRCVPTQFKRQFLNRWCTLRHQ